jgi:hypothetical protein
MKEMSATSIYLLLCVRREQVAYARQQGFDNSYTPLLRLEKELNILEELHQLQDKISSDETARQQYMKLQQDWEQLKQSQNPN